MNKIVSKIFTALVLGAALLALPAFSQSFGDDFLPTTNTVAGGTNYAWSGTNGVNAGNTVDLRNYDENVGFVFQVQGANATNTATIKFTLIRSGDPNSPSAASFETSPPYSVSVTQNGTTLVTVITNMGHDFLAPARWVQLAITNNGTVGCTNIHAYVVKKKKVISYGALLSRPQDFEKYAARYPRPSMTRPVIVAGMILPPREQAPAWRPAFAPAPDKPELVELPIHWSGSRAFVHI